MERRELTDGLDFTLMRGGVSITPESSELSGVSAFWNSLLPPTTSMPPTRKCDKINLHLGPIFVVKYVLK